jgi:hypothetical protein
MINGANAMDLAALKDQIRTLTPEDRRTLALYILELEKDHFRDNVGPQIRQDLEGVGKVLQETFEKIKKHIS